jgi:vacuolar-type H+-ATPase subunit I/STV1
MVARQQDALARQQDALARQQDALGKEKADRKAEMKDERKKSEQEMKDERKKSEQEMKDERKKSEQEMEEMRKTIEDERKKSEQEMEEMRKTMNAENTKLAAESRRLESELDAVKETANDTAEWIATGVCLSAPSFPPSFTNRIPSVPTTVRSSAELSSAIFLIVFKPGSPSTSVSPLSLILARHRDYGGKSLKD